MFIVTVTLGRELSEFLIASWPHGRRHGTSPAHPDEETVARESPEGPAGAPCPEEDCHPVTLAQGCFGPSTPLHPDST